MKPVYIFFLPIFLVSCFKQDKVAPVITLKGNPIITIPIGLEYFDPGASAKDDRDGDITYLIKVSGLPNTELAGEYTVRYNVHDASGNHAEEVTRTVYVTHQSHSVSGIFTNDENCSPSLFVSPGFINISRYGQENYKISLINFSMLPEDSLVIAEIKGKSGQLITIPPQIFGDTSVQGSGNINGTGSVINIDYTISYDTVNINCSAVLRR